MTKQRPTQVAPQRVVEFINEKIQEGEGFSAAALLIRYATETGRPVSQTTISIALKECLRAGSLVRQDRYTWIKRKAPKPPQDQPPPQPLEPASGVMPDPVWLESYRASVAKKTATHERSRCARIACHFIYSHIESYMGANGHMDSNMHGELAKDLLNEFYKR